MLAYTELSSYKPKTSAHVPDAATNDLDPKPSKSEAQPLNRLLSLLNSQHFDVEAFKIQLRQFRGQDHDEAKFIQLYKMHGSKLDLFKMMNRLNASLPSYSDDELDKVYDIFNRMLGLHLLTQHHFLGIKKRISHMHQSFKLTAKEKFTRKILACYSGVGFAGGIAGAILNFIPLHFPFAILAEIGIRVGTASAALFLEHRDQRAQAQEEDEELENKIFILNQTLNDMAFKEGELRAKCFPLIKEIDLLKFKKKQLLNPRIELADARFLQVESVFEKYNLLLEDKMFLDDLKNKQDSDNTSIAKVHKNLTTTVNNKPSFYKRYSATIRTFIGGTLTVYGTASTIVTLAGYAGMTAIPIFGIIMTGALILNSVVSYFFHKMNKHSQARNAQMLEVRDDIYQKTLTRLEHVKKLKPELLKTCVKLKKEIAEIEAAKLKQQQTQVVQENKQLQQQLNVQSGHILFKLAPSVANENKPVVANKPVTISRYRRLA
jgi:hypothetical protein